MDGLPQFDATWFPSQLFWLGVTFVVLYVYFARIILPRMESTLHARQTKQANDQAQANTWQDEAESIRAAYERDMAAARDRAARAFKDVQDRAKEKASDALYSFRTKFTGEIARMEDNLARERARIIDDMNLIAAEAAAHATSQILHTPTDVSSAQAVVNNLQRPKAA